MNEWKNFSLGDLATFKYGKMPNKKKVSDLGKYPVYSGYRYVGYYDEYNVEAGQLIVVARGVGGTGDVKLTKEKCWLTNLSIAAKIIDYEKVIPQYLYYLFRINNLRYLDSGSAQSQITIFDLERVEVILPPLETQKKIAAVLSALDDKIELNNAINKNLEEQAQTIFKSWFIDFEPFGGTMPDDWRIEELDNVTLMSAGGDKPLIISKEKTDDCPYPIYSNGISENGLYGYTDKAIINEESVTVSARGTIGFVCLRQTPYFPIVRLITLIPKKSVMSSKYLYLWLKNITIEGTGTTQQQLTIPPFKRTKILLPRYEVLERFTNMVNPSFEIAISNQLENKKLGEIRDALLPRLMSGEIDVSNVKI